MSENCFHIPATGPDEMDSMGEMLECSKCKRKILVTMGLFGTVHHMGTSVTCAECLTIDPNFSERFPDIASKIERWKDGK